MGIFRQFPYSNFHDMNMDEIIKIMREMQDEWAATKEEWASYKDFIDNYFANLDVSDEVLEALRTMASTGELNTVIDPTIAAAVAQWLADNIGPTTPAIDASLTVAGAGADAKATGDAIAIKRKLSGNISAGNYSSYFTDADNAPRGTIYLIAADITSAMIANLPRYGNNGQLITISARIDDVNVMSQFYIVRNTIYHRTSNYMQVWNPWCTSSSARGYITTTNYTDYFTDANNASLNTVYEIQAIMDETMIQNLPEYHMTTQAVLMTYCGINDTEGSANAIQFFVVGNGGTIYYRSSDYSRANWSKWEKILRQPKIYRVGLTQEYTSLTAALQAIPFGTDEDKYVLIDGGEYDIFQEYVDANIPVPPTPSQDPSFNPSTTYVTYNVWVPKNTHIIGLGNVKLKFMPTPAQLNYNENWSITTSPLNVREGCTIENIEIHAQNCRYCIHDDYNYVAAVNDAVKIYKNVTCYKYQRTAGTNYGWTEVIGIGAGKRQRIEFHNCKFTNQYTAGTNFYLHSRDKTMLDGGGTAPLTEGECSNYVLDHCVIASANSAVTGVKLANDVSTNTQRIRFDMLSCFVNGDVLSCDLGNSSTGNNANVFDITALFCDIPNIIIRDSGNLYPVKEY